MRSEVRGSSPLIYADSLGNRGGTGVYTRRLLLGISRLDRRVLAAVGGRIMDTETALASSPATGLRKVLLENLILPGIASGLMPSIVHMPAFSGRGPRRTPVAVTLHDLAFYRNPKWFPPVRSVYYRLRFRKAASNASVVITDSEFTSTEAVSLLRIPKERSRVVYLSTEGFEGADPKMFREAFGMEGRYCVCACTVEPRKNMDALLESWREVRRRHPSMTLVSAGRWGWGKRSLLRRLNGTPGVLFTGGLSSGMLASCVSGAELMIYPSYYEGFGLPPLEAASAGVPSVVSPAGALKEVYGKVATVASGFDAGSIAGAVLDALEKERDSGLLRDFASGFSVERMASDVLDVYREFQR
ncbi:MAG: hypothetical protein AVO35_03865 [Candidatus Aegiribacteria sp. MLS_C]|nr:MAG: hypothetical protein AVO35_03865 [Candidatus Aegiribacteria sp. MLS_C]